MAAGTYLRTIGIGSGIRHGQKAGLVVAKLEVFVYGCHLSNDMADDHA